MNKYIGAIALGSVILAAPSCSDTWDAHYDAGDGTSATLSLWEQIEQNPNLSKFADIAKASYYYKDEAHPLTQDGKVFTFKDMLSGTQLLTVWAPENSAISDEDYQKWMEMVETNPYAVQQQLMANSMSLWRQVATGGGIDTLRMLNGKKLAFDKDNLTLASVKMNEVNIAATNGTLHTTGSTLPFNFNIYEYLKDRNNAQANMLGTFHDYIIDNDTTYFSENNSVEGNPDANGNPTYVDSVYVTTNAMFRQTKRFPTQTNTDNYLSYQESFGANIESEDSSFVMVMPTDQAWEQAKAKIEKYYNYASIYVDNEKANNGAKDVYRSLGTEEQIDSIKQQSIKNDITSPLCFNVNLQPNGVGKKGVWNAAEFIADGGVTPKYLLNTYNDTLRTDENWDKSKILEGKAIEMSNGYGIVADNWNVPRKLYKPDLTIEVGYRSFYNITQANTTGTAESRAFSNTANAAWCDSTGHVSEDNFYHIYPASATGNPKFEFKLQGTHGENQESDVMSGKYDIYVVMVPNYYMTSNDSTIAYTLGTNGTAQVVNGDTIPVKHKIVATLNYCNNNANGKDASVSTNPVDYQGEVVDTLLLFEDFEFPYSYKNLRYSYPTLTITTKTTSSERKAGYSNNICIDRIILVSKEEE